MNLPKLNAAQFAALCGVSPSTVTNWMDEGMPCERTGRQKDRVTIDPALAVPWAIDRREPKGSERERLAAEQADKVAMENEVRRGRLIDIAIVEDVLMARAAHSAQAHDAVAGRIAYEIAGNTDPGFIRSKILAELRHVREGEAQFTLRVADAIDCVAQDVECGEAAAEPDGEPVGGSYAAPAGRKRRARKVAK